MTSVEQQLAVEAGAVQFANANPELWREFVLKYGGNGVQDLIAPLTKAGWTITTADIGDSDAGYKIEGNTITIDSVDNGAVWNTDATPQQMAQALAAAAGSVKQQSQFQSAVQTFLKVLDPHVANWWSQNGKLVREDTTSLLSMGKWNNYYFVDSTGAKDVYVYRVSDQTSPFEIAANIVGEFYRPNTNEWMGPGARFPNPNKDAAEQYAAWQQSAFKVGAGQAAMLSRLYVEGALSFNAGADAVVNIADILQNGVKLANVIGPGTLLGAVILRSKGGSLLLKFGQKELKVTDDLAAAYGSLPSETQQEIAQQIASAGSDALDMFKKLVSNAAQLTGFIERHHQLPEAFVEKFAAVGLNIEDYVIDLDKATHRLKPYGLHTGKGVENWNGAWRQFFEKTGNPSKEQILNELTRLRKQFGLE